MFDEQARHDRDEGGGGWDEDRDPTVRRAIARLMHPIPLTVLIILVSVVMLLAANVLGWDDGLVLLRMADHEFARGLITYLFAVTTIGTSVVLVLAALMGSLGDSAYQRGKEILALLLGGLADTIEDGITGFLFDGFSTNEFFTACVRAIDHYKHPDAWQEMQREAMSRDFGWERSEQKYRDVYRRVLASPRFRR
jgi:hypothetical protein